MRHLESFATRTRLMGVVGVKSVFMDEGANRYLMVLHLDFESFGVDGFHVLKNPLKAEEEGLVNSVCGGLGGEMVPLDFEEVVGLYQEARVLGLDNVSQEALGYLEIFETAPAGSDTDKVFEEHQGINETIHYMLMRLVARDEKGLRRIYTGEKPMEYPEEAALIKNTVEKTPEGDFLATALVLMDNDYYNHRYLIKGEAGGVSQLRLVDQIKLSLYEVALQVRKPQFFKIYEGDEVTGNFSRIQEISTGTTLNVYEHGILLTFFHRHNDHLKSPVYVISEDVRAYLFFTDENQLVVVGDEEAQMEDVLHSLHEIIADGGYELMEGVEVDYPIFFDFLHSDTGDFFEFLEEELD
ncbi:MAG: hypothetical protein AVO33_07730 [delta proteobacterium ML8_F1]|nr:MAG: hypothetical protein AVO33_07730 [delta proteobacterium ML8_F1]